MTTIRSKPRATTTSRGNEVSISELLNPQLCPALRVT
eukprot:CAMPEP_0175176118 /NCGR_PEP_ID=MMETSP0087-20121206/33615_1 /TAXON_ID=136419 /ORGANISM="Unknown Unknown, Strain D1" /LENGTH=36 /DNA_ID= /DNA_START= /DNA_END= /DNA_ORIENTATION=